MVGASLLCALLPLVERHRLRVAVIEAVPLYAQAALNGGAVADGYQPSYDARSTALSWGSRNIFERLGLWPALLQRATPIKQIHVSDRGHFGVVRMNAADYDLDALGYVVENGWLGQVLLGAVSSAPAIRYFCPAVVTKIDTVAGESQLCLEMEEATQRLSAGLVVVADGGRSELSSQLQLNVEQRDYRQQAIIANLTAQQPHRNVAYERFTQDGPLALLPLNEIDRRDGEQNRCALVFTVPDANVDELMGLDEQRFLATVQEKFGYRLGRLQRVGERYSYPLRLQRVSDQVRPGLVVMGNAAHTLHPVAGQGFNLALRGVADLASAIARACEQGQAPGALPVLQDYLRMRKADQRQTIAFSDRMIRLFSNNDLLLSSLRDLGLVALDTIPVAKKLFAQQAMGFSPSMPPAGMGS